MKNVFLIGDSIRCGSGTPECLGYGPYIGEYLGEGYQVFQPGENCRFAQYTQRYLFEWADKLPVPAAEISLVHWNNGAWDVIELPGEDGPFSDLPFYISSLRKVYHQIRRCFPNAKIVFANTTPIVWDMRPQWCVRRNETIRKYNEAAEQLMNELGIPVNDLYHTAEPLDTSYRADWVHFNEAGSRVLAQKVADCIKSQF